MSEKTDVITRALSPAEHRKADISRAKKLLRDHEIELHVQACGCCSSPFIELYYKGEGIMVTDGYNFTTDEEK